jgi:hypothetical protein
MMALRGVRSLLELFQVYAHAYVEIGRCLQQWMGGLQALNDKFAMPPINK